MTQRTFAAVVIACAMWAYPFPDATAARAWITFTGCSYVDHSSNDADSFTVKCGDDQFLLRLYYVDAPEANLVYSERTREQSEYFGATLDDTLNAGKRAKELVRDLLGGVFDVITRKAIAPGRGAGARYYGFVRFSGKALEKELVIEGLARIKGVIANLPDGTKSRVYLKVLAGLEEEARRQRKGLWANSKKK